MPTFMREKVHLKLEEYCEGLELLPRLEHPQAAFKFQRSSFNRRAEFLASTVPFEVCGDLFVKFGGRLWKAASSTIQGNKLGLAAQPRIVNAFLRHKCQSDTRA